MRGALDQIQDLFVGVDGGASRSRARIRDGEGRCLGEGTAGPANAWLDLTGALANVVAATRQALFAAGLQDRDLQRMHAGLGLAGVGRERERKLVLAQRLPFASVTVDTDAYAACLGAHRGGDGAILIVGTGSCGLALVGGTRTNVGGWGTIISDDGSGAALGRAALRRALWAVEGMAPRTGLAQQILDEFGQDPERMVEWAAKATPGDFARFAPWVLAWADRLDRIALTLVTEAAGDVARMLERLLACGVDAVSLVGGLAGPITPWLPPPLRARLVAPAADAMDGAIWMAQRQHGVAAAARRANA